MLICDKVSIHLGAKTLFSDLSFQIGPGEILVLMGSSGSGKSTLFNWICGHLSPAFRSAGTCHLQGEMILDIPPHKRKVGILFQDALLFPHMTVGENILFGLPPLGSKIERREKMRTLLRSIELLEYENSSPHHLSGGQQARVALIRTLASEPNMLLLDEPFSKLDENLKVRVCNFTYEYIFQHQLPTILATHSLQEAPSGAQIISLDSKMEA